MTHFEDPKVHIKLKLSGLWITTMFCYIYCDFFELYVPGKLKEMLAGEIGSLGPVTQGLLLATSTVIVVPCLMVFLSLVLPARINRWTNIVIGTLFTLLLSMEAIEAEWLFYKAFATIEAILTALVVGYAWKWPRVEVETSAH